MNNGVFEEKNTRIIIIMATIISCIHIVGSLAKYFVYYRGSIIELAELGMVYLLFLLVGFFTYKGYKASKDAKLIKQTFKCYFCPEQVMLSIMFGFVIITCLSLEITGTKGCFSDNQDCITDFMVCVFVIFPCGRYYSKKTMPKPMEVAIHFSMLFISSIMVWVLINVLNNTVVDAVSGGKIGMVDYTNGAFQLSINRHPNTVGAYSGIILLICIFMCIKKKGLLRVIYIIESIVHFAVISLSNSRGAFLALLCSLVCIAGLITFYMMKKFSVFRKLLISALVGIIVGAVAIFARNSIIKGVDSITGLSGEYGYDENAFYAPYQEENDAVRGLELTWVNSRSMIWSNAIELMLDNFPNALIGVSPKRLSNILGKKIGAENDIYTHNQFLEVGLATGIPSLIIFVVFLILLARKCIMIGFSENCGDKWKNKVIPLIILSLVIGNVMEALLLYHNYFSGCIFMLFAGWCVSTQYKTKNKTAND